VLGTGVAREEIILLRREIIKKHLWCMPFSSDIRGSFFETLLTESGKFKENCTFLSVIKYSPGPGKQLVFP